MFMCEWRRSWAAIGLVTLVTLALGGASPAAAQTYAIARFTIAGGGSTRDVGGPYTLGSTLGQAAVGQLTGGPYSLGGGFWPAGGGVVAGIEPDPGGVASVTPLALRLHPTSPNPLSAGRTTVAFDLPQNGSARVLLYDVAGRLARTLVDGELAAGRYDLAWDGTDDGGRRVGAGVYFLRLEQGGRVERQKLVVAH